MSTKTPHRTRRSKSDSGAGDKPKGLGNAPNATKALVDETHDARPAHRTGVEGCVTTAASDQVLATLASVDVLQDVSKRLYRQVFAYLRVSTGEQDVKSQQLGILDYAKRHDFDRLSFVEETKSGSIPASERILGTELLPKLQKDDVLLVAEISRLGRSVVDILTTLKVCAERGAEVHIIKQNMRLDDTLNSKILTTVLSLTAEIERELIRERTKEGQRRARDAGKHIGRPRLTDESMRRSKLDVQADRIRELAAKGVNKANLARIFNCDWLTMHTWMQRHNVSIKKAVR